MSDYKALDTDTLPARLGGIDAVTSRVGKDPSSWSVEEVGDGNLNLVFIVTGPSGAVIVKQALPYVRLVGDSWPLPLTRAFYEYHALTRQAARDPGRVPEGATVLVVDDEEVVCEVARGALAAEHVVQQDPVHVRAGYALDVEQLDHKAFVGLAGYDMLAGHFA